MSACIPCVNIKHATYINNCYPTLKEGATTPRSSELSYLTFYASAKPAKLTKVGGYIQKKVANDIKKGRKSHNLVSLHILKALIQTCHRDLNIFSKNIVKILNMLLDTRDLETLDLACETFIVFCAFHDGSTLGVDLGFTVDYESLLEKFSGFATYKNAETSLEMQYIGHRAIQAAVSSSALQSSYFKPQVTILFPPLIITLATTKNVTDALQSSGTVDIRDSAIDKHDLNPHIIHLLASHTISILFSSVTGSNVRHALVPLFDYLQTEKHWEDSQLAVDIIKTALDSAQPQYRYLLVSDVLYRMDTKEDLVNDKHATLTLILDCILNAKIPLVGISVLEILNTLFTQLITIIQQYPFFEKDPHHVEYQQAYTIQRGLIRSIGGLASQTYYDNQLNDMIGYLVSKLRPNTLLQYVDGMLIHEYRVIVLSCINSITTVSSRCLSSTTTLSEIAIPNISLETWNPALDLMHDTNPHTRIAFSKSLFDFIDTMPTSSITSPDIYPKHSFTHQNDFTFMVQLDQAILDCVLMSDFNLTDLQLVYAILCLLNRKFGIDATMMVVPLVFEIQRLVQTEQITMNARQFTIETGLIEFFTMLAQCYHINSLMEYTETLKKQRGTKDVLFSETIQDINEPTLFSANPTPNRVWIDRSTVVELLSTEGNLRDESDRHGLSLENRLFAEWGSEAFLKSEQTNRTKIAQEINGLKPRLSSPWEPERLPVTMDDKKGGIRVATFKEALAAQMNVTDDDAATTNSSQSKNSLPTSTMMKALPMKPSDMSALLNELNLTHNAPSTVSLVNPPYKSI